MVVGRLPCCSPTDEVIFRSGCRGDRQWDLAGGTGVGGGVGKMMMVLMVIMGKGNGKGKREGERERKRRGEKKDYGMGKI